MPEVTELWGPLAGLGFGGVAGAIVGYVAKKLTKMLALLLGLTFILVQLAVYQGWVQVDWLAVQATAEHAVQSDEGRALATDGWNILTANLPWGGGFVAGFAIGFKFG